MTWILGTSANFSTSNMEIGDSEFVKKYFNITIGEIKKNTIDRLMEINDIIGDFVEYKKWKKVLEN